MMNLLFAAALLGSAGAAEILYVAPFSSISHFQMMKPLMLALANRGHHVTVISHYPMNNKVKNYRDIDLRGTEPPFEVNLTSYDLIGDMIELFQISKSECESTLSSKQVQDFLKENRKFDLLFIELFNSDCFLGFAKKFPAPLVLVTNFPTPVWLSDLIANPTESAHVPEAICRLGGRMNFLDRTWNVLCQTLARISNHVYNVLVSPEIVRKHMNVNVDSLEDVKKSVSMVFVNGHHSFSGVRSYLPNVVEIGGIHIKEPKPLPQKIEKFLNESTDGAIVFTMGSMVKAHTMEPRVRKAIVNVFKKLKQRVLWKWGAELEDKPENVMVVNWLPQSDALAHENVKLFISHGGIHGVMEAVHYGVPILGIPLFGDQMTNVRNLEKAGAAMELHLEDLGSDAFETALITMLSNKRYSENAKRLSTIMRDRPLQPLESALFWSEYLLRNGGDHLRSPGVHLNWFQYHLLDVYALFCVLPVLLLYISLRFLQIL